MSATERTMAVEGRRHALRGRVDVLPYVLTSGLAGTLTIYVTLKWSSLQAAVLGGWLDLLFWALVVVLVNVFPVAAGEPQLNLDMPILLTVAILYPPEVAATLAFVAAVDIRELRAEVSLHRAIFNRCQVAVSVLVAALIFGSIAPSPEPWPHAIVGTIAALIGSYSINVLLVSIYLGLLQRRSWHSVAATLNVGRRVEFLATYLGYGILAVVFARLFAEVGPWSVAAFLIPILVAREMLLRGRRLQEVTQILRERERLLEKLFDRIVEERRDERARVAADLHDEVLQSLTYLWMVTKLAQKEAQSGVIPRITADLGELENRCGSALMALRDVIQDLRSSPLGRGGLLPTLDTLVRDLKLDWQIDISLEAPRDLQIPGDVQLVLYQVAREGLVNALKHAQPTSIRVLLHSNRNAVRLEVRDDGAGFDPQKVDAFLHFGLGLMRERVRMAGGVFNVESREGVGTRLEVRIPLYGRGRYDDPHGKGASE